MLDRDLFTGLCPVCRRSDAERRVEVVAASITSPFRIAHRIMIGRVVGSLTIIAGIVAAIMFFNAADSLESDGRLMTNLQTISGESVAEKYYQDVGYANMSYARIARACGVGVAATAVGIGGLLITRD
jgi:hypothetical protein